MSIDLQDRSSAGPRERVIRRRLSLREPDVPKHRALMALYRDWLALGDAGQIPSRHDFAPPPAAAAIDTRDIDVTALADAADESTMPDYRAACDLGMPLYHDIVAENEDGARSYARLILPFAADGRTVDRLMVCSADQDCAELRKLLG